LKQSNPDSTTSTSVSSAAASTVTITNSNKSSSSDNKTNSNNNNNNNKQFKGFQPNGTFNRSRNNNSNINSQPVDTRKGAIVTGADGTWAKESLPPLKPGKEDTVQEPV
jgi:hypothetical protein